MTGIFANNDTVILTNFPKGVGVPEGFIEMNSPKPSSAHLPTESGNWYLDLNLLKSQSMGNIDSVVGDIRSKMSINIYQQHVYSIKTDEALRYLVNPINDTGTYPYLIREAAIRKIEPVELAQMIVSKSREDIDIQSWLETIRIETKSLISTCETEAEIQHIISVFSARLSERGLC